MINMSQIEFVKIVPAGSEDSLQAIPGQDKLKCSPGARAFERNFGPGV